MCGVSVVVADMNEKEGHSTVDAITKAGGKAMFVRVDVSKPAEVQHVSGRAPCLCCLRAAIPL
jgi:hypothetical protein